jgi:CheY-like chemotaxis protein
MQRIVVLDSDHPHRAALSETLGAAGVQVTLADGVDGVLAMVAKDDLAAIFADDELLGDGAARVIGAIRAARTRPLLILASHRRADELDPDFVTLVVRKPYDVAMVVGVLLTAVLPPLPPAGDPAMQRRADG